MIPNRELALAVRRVLATGTIALCGAASMAAYAQQATTAQPAVPQATTAKAAVKSAKTPTVKKPILLAQATESTTAAAPASPAEPAQLQTVVVTGTLIARPAAETAEPITIMKADALKNQGLTNVEQAVDQITANVPGINIAQSVGQYTGGGSYVNLRDLQAERTLVLVDGQRLAPNATTGLGVDVSGIPFSAIEDVQVLRDGASSLYGSDAIAGVVNFITHKDYQGGEVQVDVNHPQLAGGGSGDANFIFGHGDLAADGYNFMVTGNYSKQNELKAQQRPFSATGINIPQGLDNTNGIGTWPGSVVDGAGNEWQPGYPACAGDPLFLTRQNNECLYEYSAATDILPQSEEESAMASFTKALPANNQIRLQYFYTRSKLTDWGGAMFYGFTMTPQDNPAYFPKASQLTCVSVPCTPFDATDPITAYWSDPNNNRYLGNINNEQRMLLTFSGTNFGWDYTADINYSQNKATQLTVADLPNEAVFYQADGSLSNLINPFGPQSAAGQALIDSSYINGPLSHGKDKLWSVDGHASHELGDAFNAGTPATVALGFSFGGENFNSATTPEAVLLAAATAFNPQVVNGSRATQAIYAELDVPMSSQIDLDISDREDRYSDFGQTNNGKISLRYQPSHFVTFRGSASTGFRAPTLNSLYGPNTLGATGGTVGIGTHTSGYGNPVCEAELLANNFPASGEFTETVCDNQGLGLYGGNRHLTPETSENFDIGIVVEPLRNLGITLDYYRILLKSPIGTIPYTAIYGNPTAFANEYVLNAAGSLSQSINLGPDCTPYTVSSCGYVLQEATNTGFITTDGVDLSVNYSQHTAIGTFAEDFEGTAITKFDLQEYTGGPVLNLVGWYNSGNQPALRWQHTLRVTWMSPDARWGAGLNNRFMSTYIDQLPDANGNPRNVGSNSTWDVYGSYKPIRPVTVLVGIRNLFNRYPPFSNQLGNWPAGYNPIYSDPTLRTFYINLKYDF
ncbi:MAG TPA: TonB-dependent receptor [Steroidobacteraceae bacterium]|jgi:iron complex outermembrane receptor protein